MNIKYLFKSYYSDVLKTLIFSLKRVCHQVSFWGAPTHADVTGF